MIDWKKEFPLTSVTRNDLKDAGIPRKVITTLSDEDMTAIAERMGELYVEYGSFWDHIGPAVAYVLERKQALD